MSAILAMRLRTYLRSYVAIAPTTAGLIVLSILYGGGVARPEEAYGVSAVVLFPVLAWQVKILLDAEPDVQRRLFRVAAGGPHPEIGAGVLAGALTALPTIALGLVLPWLFRGVSTENLGPALVVGLWLHLLAVGPAVALGAWASRPVARTAGLAVAMLASGAVLSIVLGLSSSPVQWLAPPLMAAARVANAGVSALDAIGLTAWALVWSAVGLAGYWRVRWRRV